MSHYTRRHFLSQQAFGLGGLALTWLLKQDAAIAEPAKPLLERPTFDVKPRPPAREPQARAVDQRPQPRQHRLGPPGARILVDLRTGQRKPESAGVRRAHRSGRVAGAGRRELAKRLAAFAVPRHGRPPSGAAHFEPGSAG